MKNISIFSTLVILLFAWSPLSYSQETHVFVTPMLALLLGPDSTENQLRIIDDPSSDMLALGIVDGAYLAVYGTRDADGWASRVTHQAIVATDASYQLTLTYDDQGNLISATDGSTVYAFLYLSPTRVRITATYADGSEQVEETDISIVESAKVMRAQPEYLENTTCGGLLKHYGKTVTMPIHTQCDDYSNISAVEYEYTDSGALGGNPYKGIIMGDALSNFSRDGHINKYLISVPMTLNIPTDYDEYSCSCGKLVDTGVGILEGLKSMTGLSGALTKLVKQPLDEIIFDKLKDMVSEQDSLVSLLSKSYLCSEVMHKQLLQNSVENRQLEIKAGGITVKWRNNVTAQKNSDPVSWYPLAADTKDFTPILFPHPMTNGKAVLETNKGYSVSGSAPLNISFNAFNSFPLNEMEPSDSTCAQARFTLSSENGELIRSSIDTLFTETLSVPGTYKLELELLGVEGAEIKTEQTIIVTNYQYCNDSYCYSNNSSTGQKVRFSLSSPSVNYSWHPAVSNWVTIYEAAGDHMLILGEFYVEVEDAQGVMHYCVLHPEDDTATDSGTGIRYDPSDKCESAIRSYLPPSIRNRQYPGDCGTWWNHIDDNGVAHTCP